MTAVLDDRVSVVAEYDQVVRSPSFEMALPSIIALRHYVDLSRPAAMTRFGVFLRDGFRCLYCGGKFEPSELTFDHVIPRSRGGGSGYENIASACTPCNSRKANRTPAEAGMKLLGRVYHPTRADLNKVGRRYPPDHCHETWLDYLYWDTELEE